MRKSLKVTATLATLVSVGAGAIKRHLQNKRRKTASREHVTSPDAHFISNAYSQLSGEKRQRVNRVGKRIIPQMFVNKNNDFAYQLNLHRYFEILKYLSTRDEFHAEHASRMLTIPLNRVKLMTISLSQQQILEHTPYGNYVRRNLVENNLEQIAPYLAKNNVVNPKEFTPSFLNLIATNMYLRR